LELFREFTFEAAHHLPNAPPGHKCKRLHGHSYRVSVHVRGTVDGRSGWVMDFGEITKAFEPVRNQLNHSCLNDLEGLANPTSEAIARWIWQRLQPLLPGLSRIVVRETDDSGCIYEGEDR